VVLDCEEEWIGDLDYNGETTRKKVIAEGLVHWIAWFIFIEVSGEREERWKLLTA